MCSQYALQTTKVPLLQDLDLQGAIPDSINQRLLPKSLAPVIVLSGEKLKLTPMKFSLVPSWSQTPQVKFATHNARIESILEKPTWKMPFVTQHCVVPMTSFFESAYSGPLAGNIIKFSRDNNQLLYAAGIFDFWKDHDKPENSFFSFSVLTRDPSDFIIQNGHDRTPIFIPPGFVKDWLSPLSKPGDEIKAELLKNAFHPDLKVDVDRAMKLGWEKRV